MSHFVIVGAGGLGRELLGWIEGCGGRKRERFKVTAFVSERKTDGGHCHGIPIVHPDALAGQTPRFVVAIADPTQKKRLALHLLTLGWEPEIFVHDSTAIGIATNIGRGTIVSPHCCISTDCKIGEHVLVNASSGIGHDTIVGSYSSLLGAVSLNGNVQVGEGVLFGARSMVYPGKKIGSRATIGIGSVVLRNVAEGATMFGNPAQRIDAR